ncbi:MAG TPA: polyprenyl synthetase family protein [Anaerolineales bacterium]
MNIYESTVDYISNQPVLKAWPEAKIILNRAASNQPRDWRLPVLVCEAVGGKPEQSFPACACVACALIGILLIDDMLDDDPRGEFRRVGQAQAANFASAFLSAASQAILQSQAEPSIKLSAIQSMTQMNISVAFGQYLDVQNPADEAAYWCVVHTKSSPFFRSAFELGALFGGASMEVVRKIGNIGYLYGEMIQIHDDMNDCMAEPANPDWTQGRFPLPILFAQSVNHADQHRFLELRPHISDAEALHEAQEILIRSGAISYCVDQLLRKHQQARTIMAGIDLVCPDKVETLLDWVIAPVKKLLDEVGVEAARIL